MDAIDNETLGQRLNRLPPRFWNKVRKGANDGSCWEWTGARSPKGYGVFGTYGTQTDRAHRLVLMCKLGRPILLGFQALHTCDNPPCVNPDHLTEGAPAENSGDMVRRGRQAKGAAHPRSVLTEAQVREIRAATGTQRQIAARYGIAPAHVFRIRNRKCWAHVA